MRSLPRYLIGCPDQWRKNSGNEGIDLGRAIRVSGRDYVARIVMATHPGALRRHGIGSKKCIRYGASPRAALAIVLGAKARALLSGRFNAVTSTNPHFSTVDSGGVRMSTATNSTAAAVSRTTALLTCCRSIGLARGHLQGGRSLVRFRQVLQDLGATLVIIPTDLG
jgi:hypothetical protein